MRRGREAVSADIFTRTPRSLECEIREEGGEAQKEPRKVERRRTGRGRGAAPAAASHAKLLPPRGGGGGGAGGCEQAERE